MTQKYELWESTRNTFAKYLEEKDIAFLGYTVPGTMICAHTTQS